VVVAVVSGKEKSGREKQKQPDSKSDDSRWARRGSGTEQTELRWKSERHPAELCTN
jgi:hypothetical protein